MAVSSLVSKAMLEGELFFATAICQQTRLEGIFPTESGRAVWTPNTDVYLTEEKAVIKLELAGVQKEDLELTVEGNRIRIRGIRRDEQREGPCRFLMMEIHYGPFETVVEVPPEYNPTEARAVYTNGFLTILIPRRRKEPRRPTSVPIEEG